MSTQIALETYWAPSSSGLGHHPLKVAARVRIPLGLQMKAVFLITSLLVVAACGGSSELVSQKPTGVAESISAVVCESTPTTMQSAIQSVTKESWQCKRDEKTIKLDVYSSEAEKNKASNDALSMLGTTGGAQTWADTPILCGEMWTMGVADIETRDALIAVINSADISAATC